MALVDRIGSFRADVIECGSMANESTGSTGVLLKFQLKEIWVPPESDGDEGGWAQWDHGQTVSGYVNIEYQKDGASQLNRIGIEQLKQHVGWPGTLESIRTESWVPTPCQVLVEENTNSNYDQFRVSRVSGFDSIPGAGGMQTMDEAKSRSFDARAGGSIRAIAGNAARAASKPSSPPPKAPVATRDPNAELQQEGHGQTGPGGAGDAPFDTNEF